MKDILIFSGQSNMQGQTEALPPQIPLDGAWEYRYLSDKLVPLCHPVGETIGEVLLWKAHEGKGSMLPDFCKAYMQQTHRDVVAVHVARGSTKISEWLSPSQRFDAFMSKCRAAIKKVADTDTIGKIFLVWLQGESDALSGVSCEEYKNMLREFKSSVTAQIALDAFTIIRVGKFAGDERDLEIIRAQEELGKTDEFVLLTRITGMCTQDPNKWINPFANGHYNNAAMAVIGSAAGTNLGKYACGEPFVLEEEPYGDLTV